MNPTYSMNTSSKGARNGPLSASNSTTGTDGITGGEDKWTVINRNNNKNNNNNRNNNRNNNQNTQNTDKIIVCRFFVKGICKNRANRCKIGLHLSEQERNNNQQVSFCFSFVNSEYCHNIQDCVKLNGGLCEHCAFGECEHKNQCLYNHDPNERYRKHKEFIKKQNDQLIVCTKWLNNIWCDNNCKNSHPEQCPNELELCKNKETCPANCKKGRHQGPYIVCSKWSNYMWCDSTCGNHHPNQCFEELRLCIDRKTCPDNCKKGRHQGPYLGPFQESYRKVNNTKDVESTTYIPLCVEVSDQPPTYKWGHKPAPPTFVKKVKKVDNDETIYKYHDGEEYIDLLANKKSETSPTKTPNNFVTSKKSNKSKKLIKAKEVTNFEDDEGTTEEIFLDNQIIKNHHQSIYSVPSSLEIVIGETTINSPITTISNSSPKKKKLTILERKSEKKAIKRKEREIKRLQSVKNSNKEDNDSSDEEDNDRSDEEEDSDEDDESSDEENIGRKFW